MQIAELRIENFRGIREGRVRFGPHTVLIGPNNSGKTTVIEALALLFGRDRLVRTLTEHDFYGGNPQPPDRLRLIATISGFPTNDPNEHSDWFRNDRAVVKWLDPTTGDIHAARENAAWQLCCQIAFAARFDRPSLEVETARYFHDDDAANDIFADDIWTPVPAALIREIGFFLVPASRTWDRIISFGSELFRRVVASSGGPPAESVLTERDRLRAPAPALEADENLAPIVAELNQELACYFSAKPSLRLRLTSTDSESVLEAVVPHYAFGAQLCLPARRQGSGLVSLQYLILLLQFGRRRAEIGEGFWMALEEPELHVPPALQRRLIHRLQGLSTQTFVSTHSPFVASISDPQALLIVRNTSGRLSATPFLARALPAETPNAIRKLFQLYRTDTVAALMHDIVLIPEGRIDVDWVRLILRAIDAQPTWAADSECRFSSYIGLIPTSDAAVVASYQALSHLHTRVVCFVDGDGVGAGYAAELAGLQAPPAVIVRWPNGWTIENVVGWIAEADAQVILDVLAQTMVPPPGTIADLVARLRSNDREAHGLKADQIAYEAVVDAISKSATCLTRARELMNALTSVFSGEQTIRFIPDAGGHPSVRVFQP
jgi:hypothetical protein